MLTFSSDLVTLVRLRLLGSSTRTIAHNCTIIFTIQRSPQTLAISWIRFAHKGSHKTDKYATYKYTVTVFGSQSY